MHVGCGPGKSGSREVRGAGRDRKVESLLRDDAEKELLSVYVLSDRTANRLRWARRVSCGVRVNSG